MYLMERKHHPNKHKAGWPNSNHLSHIKHFTKINGQVFPIPMKRSQLASSVAWVFSALVKDLVMLDYVPGTVLGVGGYGYKRNKQWFQLSLS